MAKVPDEALELLKKTNNCENLERICVAIEKHASVTNDIKEKLEKFKEAAVCLNLHPILKNVHVVFLTVVKQCVDSRNCNRSACRTIGSCLAITRKQENENPHKTKHTEEDVCITKGSIAPACKKIMPTPQKTKQTEDITEGPTVCANPVG